MILVVMPGCMFPNLERASHSLVQRQNKVWAVKAVVWLMARPKGGHVGRRGRGPRHNTSRFC
jgi:hypothetical protein